MSARTAGRLARGPVPDGLSRAARRSLATRGRARVAATRVGTDTLGVVVVDHGSRRKASNELLARPSSVALASSPSLPPALAFAHRLTTRPMPRRPQEEFVRMYVEHTGRELVELAHMEIAEPSIDVAFARCVERGATLVAVSPFFLSPGRHWQEVRRPHPVVVGRSPRLATPRPLPTT